MTHCEALAEPGRHVVQPNGCGANCDPPAPFREGETQLKTEKSRGPAGSLLRLAPGSHTVPWELPTSPVYEHQETGGVGTRLRIRACPELAPSSRVSGEGAFFEELGRLPPVPTQNSIVQEIA